MSWKDSFAFTLNLFTRIKMTPYVWTEEEVEYFLQVIKVNNRTTIIDSKQTVKQQDKKFSSSTSNHSAETPANQVVLN